MPIKYYVNKMIFAIKKGDIWTIGKLEITSGDKKVAYPPNKMIQKKLEKRYGELKDFKLLEQEKYSYYND